MQKHLIHIVFFSLLLSVGIFFLLKNTFVFGQTSNLLPNGGFESGNLSNWTTNGTMAVVTSPVKIGTYAAHSSNGRIRQTVTVQTGKTYKLTAWVYLNQFTGNDWGGSSITINDPASSGWVQLAGTGYFHSVLPQKEWTKVGMTFTAKRSTVIVEAGYTGGGGNISDVYLDDMQIFEKPSANTLPSVTINSNTQTISSIPGDVQFTSSSNDTDGGVAYYFWEFADGGRSNNPNPTHAYAGNGTYTAKLTVYDDDGGLATATRTITANDSTYPSITVNATPSTASNSNVAISGVAQGGSGASISKVEYSTDRGLKGVFSGTNSWNGTINLQGYGGRNRILVQATDSNGKIAKSEFLVTYQPLSKVNIVNGPAGVTQNSGSIEQYEKLEATFSIQDSQSTNPYVPYETNLPAGMNAVRGQGISVEGVFTSPSGKVYRQPGFLYQSYTRNTSSKTLTAQGDPVWKIRFAPLEKGNWTYTISLTDASGNTIVSDTSKLKFTVVNATSLHNHGFINVSPTDNRYFEFSDGTAFIGVGPAAYIGGDSFETDNRIAKVGDGNSNLSRTWMSGNNIGGSSWGPWTGGIDYEGNYPGTSLTTEEAYADGIYSLTFPQANGSGKKCSYFGFQGVKPSVKPNTNYRVFTRLKTVGVAGTGGFNVRFGGVNWPGGACDTYSGTSPFTAPVKGTKDWHVITGTWNSGSNSLLGYVMLTLENTTAGRVYLDEISIREDLGNGKFGAEILPRSKLNVHEYFSQEPSWNWDYGLDESSKHGLYNKPVIEEKGDFAFNHISEYGFPFDKGEKMGKVGGASMKYQEYYWRYLTARYGYSRAIHSWEYANEQAPGSMNEGNALGSYIKLIDPIKHLATTSFWCCIQTGGNYYWQEIGQGKTYSGIDYADAHAYVNAPPDNTSWLKDSTYPLNVGSVTLSSYSDVGNDTALYVYGHSMDVLQRNASGGKPIIMGETGAGNGSVIAGQNDSDTKGVWLHQLLWAQVNPGPMYFIYWFDENIMKNNLYSLFGMYRKFMEGQPADTINKRIPLSNGKYNDIQLTSPSGIYAWGQKDIANGGAHFWAYDKNYTWQNTGGGAVLANKQFSFTGLPAKQYTIEFWNTWTGTVTTQNLNFSGGTMNITIPSNWTEKDVAVKIIPSTGYPGSVAPSTAPTQPPKPGDANNDGKVDGIDYIIWLNHYNQNVSGPSNGDFNSDGKVDGIDYIWWLNNYGK